MNPNDDHLSPAESEAYRARQRARSKVLGLILGALAVLFFAITIVKMSVHTSGQM
jgi:hypothetical protein